ncbi:MAG: pyruvate kinase [Nitrospiria bacterium]
MPKKMTNRRTKIVATYGPAIHSPETLARLMKAGVNVFRLNFSHGTQKSHAEAIRLIRQVSAQQGALVAILQDLQGPKVRIGPLQAPSYVLKRNALFRLFNDMRPGTDDGASTDYPDLWEKVSAGDQVLINDGKIVLKVLEIKAKDIACRVLEGGVLTEHKGVNVPGRDLGFPALTEKDRDDLAFGLSQEVDYIGLSMVRTAEDVVTVKQLVRRASKNTPIIAKLEQAQAIEHLSEIMAVSDGVMVARGDLGVEIPLEQVPLLQKKIIKMANEACIPVITATQMLESMIENTRPTRAEASDVANAIFDGTDAVMLSGETATGKYPVRTVQVMARIITTVERELPPIHISPEKGLSIPEAVSQAACHLATHMDAKAIVTSTLSGGSARRLSKYRPGFPIFAFTPLPGVARRMNLYWGVYPSNMAMLEKREDIFEEMIHLIRSEAFAKQGDLLVMVTQSPRRGSKDAQPPTDLIKVHQL